MGGDGYRRRWDEAKNERNESIDGRRLHDSMRSESIDVVTPYDGNVQQRDFAMCSTLKEYDNQA